jgi:hypothetical protein
VWGAPGVARVETRGATAAILVVGGRVHVGPAARRRALFTARTLPARLDVAEDGLP